MFIAWLGDRRLTACHFWTTEIGIAMYVIGLTVGGVIQGVLLKNPDIPFIETVAATIPWLWSRSIAGVLLTIGHIEFALLVWRIVPRRGPAQAGPVYFRTPPEGLFSRGDGGGTVASSMSGSSDANPL